jgi:hypothetical protein
MKILFLIKMIFKGQTNLKISGLDTKIEHFFEQFFNGKES